MPTAWLADGFPCAVKLMIGSDCPGCGLLRSWSLLGHAHWLAALRIYPLGPLILFGVSLYILDEFRVLALRNRSETASKPLVRKWISSPWMGILPLMLFIQWIAKLIIL